ncbi:TfdA family taurine catabolism dioxygenase TauD [Ceratobasidium sp. AG-Ba]|nr:TfdA family taurine catabolism dioxygenase TauD [Ceratobasidium sp. AG-Ba]
MAPPVATDTTTQTHSSGSLPLFAANPKSDYPFEHLLPVFDKSEHYPPLTPFEHVDPAARASELPEAEQRTFLRTATRVRNLTPKIGTEVTGIDLTSLDGPARDQLALEVARRGVVVFRDQPKFLAQTAEQFREWGSYFGRLHIHPTSGHPALIPELHLVYRDGNETFNHEQFNRISTTLWHSDVSYERQPPGLTTFFLLAQPSSGGGDTSFVSQVQALKKLSAPFVAWLRTLTAVHSGVQQAEYSRSGRRGGVVRRDPVEHVHPVVRKHPVTGEEALYVNQQFTTRIVGLKQEESENILSFLFNHIARVADAQARVNWEPNTVVIWDNRVTAHTAIIDFAESGERRHGARITPQAERPIPALDSLVVE